MNPYAKHLGDREAITVLTETVPRLRELLAQIGTDGIGRPYAPGKWDVRQILVHLAQVELVFGTRFRFALACDDYTVQPFEQDDWMRHEPFEEAAVSFDTLAAMRAWNLALLTRLTPADRAKKFNHPEVGEITMDYLIERLAGHDLNHLAQLEAVAANKAEA